MANRAGPRLVSSELILDVDVATIRSYSGTGLTANGLIAGIGGTLVNGVAYNTSNFGYFTFDGTNDFIDFGNSSTVQQSTGTLSVWAKSSSPGSGFRGIFAKQYAYALFYADSILASFDWSTFSTLSTGINIADGSWKNLVMTYQSGVASGTIIYLNGLPVLTTTLTIVNQAVGNLFGGSEANASQYAACDISMFLMYNRVLTAQEILQNYNATKGRYI